LVAVLFIISRVAVNSSHMTASSSASWSRFSPASNFVNRHVSTMWFTVCRWPQSQESDWVRFHLCKLARHGPWPVAIAVILYYFTLILYFCCFHVFSFSMCSIITLLCQCHGLPRQYAVGLFIHLCIPACMLAQRRHSPTGLPSTYINCQFGWTSLQFVHVLCWVPCHVVMLCSVVQVWPGDLGNCSVLSRSVEIWNEKDSCWQWHAGSVLCLCCQVCVVVLHALW